MAETFHHFPDLPKELRLKIWEQVLIEARPSRRIIIDEGRVVPFKQLISPLLLVNYESRTCAKAFYNVKLDIYAVPPVTKDQVKHLDKQQNWDRINGSERAVEGKIHDYHDEWTENEFEQWRLTVPYDDSFYDHHDIDDEIERINREEEEYTVDLEEHWSNFVRDELLVLGESSIRRAEASGPTTGALYISPEHDVFVTDCDCRMNFSIDSASKILGEDFPSIQHVPCHHISNRLSTPTCQRISTLVIVRLADRRGGFGLGRDRHCVFSDYNAVEFGGGKNGFNYEFTSAWCRDRYQFCCWRYKRTWKKAVFPNVQAHFVLRFGYRDRTWEEWGDDCLKRFMEMDDELFRDLELWEEDDFSKHEGKKIKRAFGKKWSSRYNAPKAELVRVLMAHWDISD